MGAAGRERWTPESSWLATRWMWVGKIASDGDYETRWSHGFRVNVSGQLASEGRQSQDEVQEPHKAGQCGLCSVAQVVSWEGSNNLGSVPVPQAAWEETLGEGRWSRADGGIRDSSSGTSDHMAISSWELLKPAEAEVNHERGAIWHFEVICLERVQAIIGLLI